jgi:hypothetical protein
VQQPFDIIPTQSGQFALETPQTAQSTESIEEIQSECDLLIERLSTHLQIYEAALKLHGLELPYSK